MSETKNRVLVIAEAGVNHNGDLRIALELVDQAAAAGADLVKFQSFITELNIGGAAPKAQYQIANSSVAGESQYEMIKRLELSRDMHEVLLAHCESRGIGFFSTGFDVPSIDLLVKLGLDCMKIPSGEITNLPYLRHIGRLGKRVLLSTGMATLGDVERAIEVLEAEGTPRALVTVLHCTSEYPTPMADVNLRAMRAMGDAFGVAIGYSDHTPGIEVAIAAVAMGASVIEKHFTMDRNLPGPDHKASLEPAELAMMVAAIRNIEQALGDGIKRPTAGELENRPIARKSLVAARPIRLGEKFTAENIAAKRPGTGVSPMRWDEVIGKVATRHYGVDDMISL